MVDNLIDEKMVYCSFCGKSKQEVRKLIAGPTVFICNECVYVCVTIIAEDVPLDSKTLREALAQQAAFIAALVKAQQPDKKNDGGNHGGDQD